MNVPQERIKRCTKCKQMLPISGFYVNCIKPTGTVVYNGRCKPCTVKAVSKGRAERRGKRYETRAEWKQSKGIAKANRLTAIADAESAQKVAKQHRKNQWKWSKAASRARGKLLRLIKAKHNESVRWRAKMYSVASSMKRRAQPPRTKRKPHAVTTWGKSASTARTQLKTKVNRHYRIQENPWTLLVETKARNLRRRSGRR